MFKVLTVLSVLTTPTFSLKWSPDSYYEPAINRSLMFAFTTSCPPAEIRTWTCLMCAENPGFETYVAYESGECFGYIGFDAKHNQVVAAFEGTANIQNWITDVDAVRVAYPNVHGGYVHKGFYNAWKTQLAPVILPAMQSLMDYHFGADILVTGHSLGAALAQLAALDFFHYANVTKNSGYRRVHTFGSPRWSNKVMADFFESTVDTHWRVVHKHDIVPKLPPPEMGFHHAANEVWYMSDEPKDYRMCDGSGEDPECKYWQASADDHMFYLNTPCCCGP